MHLGSTFSVRKIVPLYIIDEYHCVSIFLTTASLQSTHFYDFSIAWEELFKLLCYHWSNVYAQFQVDESCEEWPVQKCELTKKTVRKVHPETECRKIPREVCVPNNCAMEQGDEVCRDEVRMQVQNVPQEECELQPEENCHAEAVLVPR